MPRPANSLAACIGENFARARKRSGLSQEELAVMASLHRTEISLVECGARLPRIDTVIKLAGALEISLDALIDGVGWSPGSVQLGGFSLPDRSVEELTASEMGR